MLAAWDAYREAKAKGLPLPRIGRKKRPAASPKPPNIFVEAPEQRRERIAKYLRERYPDRGF
jgi:hypothetical protein